MIRGVDVAKYQPTNPDPSDTLNGISFYIAKATEGLTPDPTYAAHIQHARNNKIPLVAAYHFCHGSIDAKAQALKFLEIAGDVDAYVVDREGQDEFTEIEFKTFQSVLAANGKLTGLYGSLSGYPSWGQDWRWIAYYNPTPPTIAYDIWQYGSYAPNVDGDIYQGTIAQLKGLWKVGQQIPITDRTEKIITAPANHTWYDLDGTVLSTGHPALTARNSPYGAGKYRAVFTSGTGGVNTRVTLLVPDTITDIPPLDCTQQIADAITADRAKAHIVEHPSTIEYT